MKKLLSVILALFLVSPVFGWEGKPKSGGAVKDVIERVWEGEIDLDMMHKIQNDLKWAKDEKVKVLKVTLMSPGGPVITSLEAARLVRDASESGLVIEIHAVGLCASGCTLVLAAGTPGKRYISKSALFLLHAVQTGGGFFSAPTCAEYKPEPKDEGERIVNALLNIMRDSYVRFTGKTPLEVEKWLSCGYEIVGSGSEAVGLGVADVLE